MSHPLRLFLVYHYWLKYFADIQQNYFFRLISNLYYNVYRMFIYPLTYILLWKVVLYGIGTNKKFRKHAIYIACNKETLHVNKLATYRKLKEAKEMIYDLYLGYN